MAQQSLQLYFGEPTALVGEGKRLALTTVHPDGRPTAVWWLDLDTLTLNRHDLSAGGVALLRGENHLLVAGTDRQLYRIEPKRKSAKAIGDPFDSDVLALAELFEDRVAVLLKSECRVVSRKNGKLLQTLEFLGEATVIASDPTGRWIAIGHRDGAVTVFEAEDRDTWEQSDRGELHEDAVTGILFEPDELRFYSTAADRTLCSTHARGRLEPEDRGRSFMPKTPLTDLCWIDSGGKTSELPERFATGGEDGSLKSWERGSNRQPATLGENFPFVIAITAVSRNERPHLAVACKDATIRVVSLDKDGKFRDVELIVRDVYAWANAELSAKETDRREDGLRTLADLGDERAVARLTKQITKEDTATLRQLAVKLLARIDEPTVRGHLEDLLSHRDPVVGTTAFVGLRRIRGEDDLELLRLAIGTKRAGVGTAAIEAAIEPARTDDQASEILVDALESPTEDIRLAALSALELIHPPDSPEGLLIGFRSGSPFTREAALVRMWQRELLQNPPVVAAVRRALDDDDYTVRQVAFLISALRRPKLVAALRSRDPEFHRELAELERPASSSEKKQKELPPPPKPKKSQVPLTAGDDLPLLEAMAASHRDTALRGAVGLATVGDPRAFGMLLQMSRESNPTMVTKVAQALGRLGERRAEHRLRSLLQDDAPDVRDAAYTAVTELFGSDGLEAIDLGLGSPHADVRKRAMADLLAVLRSKPAAKKRKRGIEIFARLLDDPEQSLRQEAFKATLGLPVGTDQAESLAFALKSSWEDVRRQVLTEAISEQKKPWGRELLGSFLHDPSPKLRQEAFDVLRKAAKKTDFSPFAEALGSDYTDTRLAAVEELRKRSGNEVDDLLASVLGDESAKVRRAAFDGLTSNVVTERVRQALDSRFDDVRLLAARHLARLGVAEARPVLAEFVTVAEPERGTDAERKRWRDHLVEGLRGLGDLAAPASVAPVMPLLEHSDAVIRRAAIATLVFALPETETTSLRAAMKHHDPAVRARAALGLAYRGDESVREFLFGPEAAEKLKSNTLLLAAALLGEAGSDRLIGYLDDDSEELAQTAFRLLMIREWLQPGDFPNRCLAALASRRPRIRLRASDGLVAFPEPERFTEFVVEVVNQHPSQERDWTLSEKQIRELAAGCTLTDPLVRLRFLKLLLMLGVGPESRWKPHWTVHRRRFDDETSAAIAAIEGQGTPSRPAPEQMRTIAFGTYVGLLGEQGSVAALGTSSASVRQSAIRRLAELGESEELTDSVRSPLLLAVSDSNNEVRELAFDRLLQLKTAPSELALTAMTSGHRDQEVRGLELLITGEEEDRANEVLRKTLLEQSGNVALEAATLLASRTDEVSVATVGVGSTNPSVRVWALSKLGTHAVDNSEARGGLRSEVRSKYLGNRLRAISLLAKLRDAEAFDPIADRFRQTTDPEEFRGAGLALLDLNGTTAPGVIFERLDSSLPVEFVSHPLLTRIGELHARDQFEPLFAMLDDDRYQSAAYSAALETTGFNQRIPERTDDPVSDFLERFVPDDDRPPFDYSLHGDLFARLLEWSRTQSDSFATRRLKTLLTKAHWPEGPEVDVPLDRLASHPDETVRPEAIRVIGWRVRHRERDAEILSTLLEGRDRQVKFLAAVMLAYSGNATGVPLLRTAVDLMPDLGDRETAVLALGHTADERALAQLFDLASDEGHALQEAALAAIGHLSTSTRADDILELVLKFGRGDDGRAVAALRGLAAFDSPRGWELIRNRCRELGHLNYVITPLLVENDVPETRELLLHLCRTAPGYYASIALQTARELFGEENREPDYALLGNHAYYEIESSLRRLAEQSDPQRLLDVLPVAEPDVADQIVSLLRAVESFPDDVLMNAVGAADARTVGIAADFLVRDPHPTKPFRSALGTALGQWIDRTQTRSDRYDESPISAVDRLFAAAVRCGVGPTSLLESYDQILGVSDLASIRESLVFAMREVADPAVRERLTEVATQGSPEARSLAVRSLVTHSEPVSDSLIGTLLEDQPRAEIALRHRTDAFAKSESEAVRNSQQQSSILPTFLRAGQFKELGTVARDASLADGVRFGAVEALGMVADPQAVETLVALGTDDKLDEEFRKAAWRCRRRCLRLIAGTVSLPTPVSAER